MSEEIPYAKINDRVLLRDALPVQTPFVIGYSPTSRCNFRCRYCFHRFPDYFPDEPALMSIELYKKSIDDLAGFPGSVKKLVLGGFGEPLLHPNIVEMVEYAVRKQAAQCVEIITNASLLNKKMADGLVQAGLGQLRVSLQGIDQDAYFRSCGMKIDFNRFIDQLGYFYQQRGPCVVQAKMIDSAFRSEEEKNEFARLFEPISDHLYIECDVPYYAEHDPTPRNEGNRTKNNLPVHRVDICSRPFFHLMLWPSGRIAPCCVSHIAIELGRVPEDHLVDVWNSLKRKRFLEQLIRDRSVIPACKECLFPDYEIPPPDILDPWKQELSELFSTKTERTKSQIKLVEKQQPE